jgi:hypothetical protein
MTHDAVGLYFCIDNTVGESLSVALSKDRPESPEDERSHSLARIRFLGEATPIAQMSDGVKAYTGILIAALSAELKVILFDEPDAFLHPPLARRLGSALATVASERSGNVFAATHDANFLWGCIHSGKPVNIVRLSYKNEQGSATMLTAEAVRPLMRDALLRSTRVLDALFHQGAVVCEADRDRVFYKQINEPLLRAGRVGAADALFLNAQNKQTIRRIVGPLRSMGIPAAAIVDLDVVVKGKANDLKDLMNVCHVPEGLVNSLGSMRGEVEAAFNRKGLEPKKAGIGRLDDGDRQTAETLLDNLRRYGIFPTPVGEVEGWLPSLEILSRNEAQKREWLVKVLQAIGDDPEDATYLRPGADDVWGFVEQVGTWLGDADRRGMP